MLNFILCDDDIHMIHKLSLLFEKAFIKNDFDAKIVLKTRNYQDILSFMSDNVVNVVVLDIEFKNSKMNGLDIADEIRKINKDCYIIFITSHFEYLMEAYDYKTFAYLFKNSLSVDTLSDTLTRLFDDISGNTKKFLKIDNKGTFIDLNDIQFIEKSGMKLVYHTLHGCFDTYNSFSKIENRETIDIKNEIISLLSLILIISLIFLCQIILSSLKMAMFAILAQNIKIVLWR